MQSATSQEITSEGANYAGLSKTENGLSIDFLADLNLF